MCNEQAHKQQVVQIHEEKSGVYLHLKQSRKKLIFSRNYIKTSLNFVLLTLS